MVLSCWSDSAYPVDYMVLSVRGLERCEGRAIDVVPRSGTALTVASSLASIQIEFPI